MVECLTVEQQERRAMKSAGLARRIARQLWRPWLAADRRLAREDAARLLETDVVSMLSIMMPVADGDPERVGRVGLDILEGTLGQNPASRAARDAFAYAFGARDAEPSFEGCKGWTHPHEKACESFARELSGKQCAGQRFKVVESVSGALADSLNYCIAQNCIRWPTEAYEARELARELRENLARGRDLELAQEGGPLKAAGHAARRI